MEYLVQKGRHLHRLRARVERIAYLRTRDSRLQSISGELDCELRTEILPELPLQVYLLPQGGLLAVLSRRDIFQHLFIYPNRADHEVRVCSEERQPTAEDQ